MCPCFRCMVISYKTQTQIQPYQIRVQHDTNMLIQQVLKKHDVIRIGNDIHLHLNNIYDRKI